MLRIRLRRTGRKNRPNYRIVVAEHSAPIGGKFVDQIGHYDPRTKEMGFDSETLTKWLNVGAKPSNRVAKLLITAGVSHKLIVVEIRPPRAPKNAPEEPKPAKTVVAEADEPTATAEEAPEASAEAEAAPAEEPGAEPTEETPAAE